MTFAANPPYSHGTLMTYFKIPEDFCYKLPSFIGLDEGVMVEPLSVAVHVCRLADVRAGQDVIIIDLGTIGLIFAAFSKAMGARKTISVDVNSNRLVFARIFPIAHFSPPVEIHLKRQLRR